MLTQRDLQISVAILGMGAAATAAKSANLGNLVLDQTFSTLSLPATDTVATQNSDALQVEVVGSADSDLPRRGDFFDMLVDTVIIPETKVTPPVVATEADKFAMLVMAPSLFMGVLIGLAFTGNWIGRKMGWIKYNTDER